MQSLLKGFRLSPSEWMLLIQSIVVLNGIRLGLRFLPFRTWQQKLQGVVAQGHYREENPAAVEQVVWAVNVVSRRSPGVKCLARALTTQILLIWQGQPSELCIGVAQDNGQFAAHAWVEHRGKIVIGKLPDLNRYQRLPALTPLSTHH